MRIEDIKILPCYLAHPPRTEKIEQKEWQYLKSGMLEADIVVDIQGTLIDGYCWYLLAKKYELTCVPVRCRRQIIRASHKKGGKMYAWELPALLIGRVSVGEKLIVRTSRGIRTVTVAAVEEYNPEQQIGPLRRAIRKKRKGAAA